jgi:hypothetical protein
MFKCKDRVMVAAAAALQTGSGSRRLITTETERFAANPSADDAYKVPGRMGKSEGKLFLRSEFPRPNAGVSSILGVDSEDRHHLFVGPGRHPKFKAV